MQAFELSQQLDLLIKAIKDGDFNAYDNAVVRDNMLPHYLYSNMFYPVHVACEFGRLDILKHMVEVIKVNLDVRCNITGYTPIMYACQTGQIHIVEYLSKSHVGADLTAKATLQRRDDYQTMMRYEDDHSDTEGDDNGTAVSVPAGRDAVDILVDSKQ